MTMKVFVGTDAIESITNAFLKSSSKPLIIFGAEHGTNYPNVFQFLVKDRKITVLCGTTIYDEENPPIHLARDLITGNLIIEMSGYAYELIAASDIIRKEEE